MAKAGKPAHQPSDALRLVVSNLSCIGWTHDQIAGTIGITANTLRKHYPAELASAKGLRVAEVYGALFNNAVTHNNVAAQIFLAKTQGGMKETQVSEVSGPDGQPLIPMQPPVFHVLFAAPDDDAAGGSQT